MSKKTKKQTAAKPKAETVATIQKKSKFEFIVVNILCLLVFLAFGYIGVMSFFQTSVFDPSQYVSERDFI